MQNLLAVFTISTSQLLIARQCAKNVSVKGNVSNVAETATLISHLKAKQQEQLKTLDVTNINEREMDEHMFSFTM